MDDHTKPDGFGHTPERSICLATVVLHIGAYEVLPLLASRVTTPARARFAFKPQWHSARCARECLGVVVVRCAGADLLTSGGVGLDIWADEHGAALDFIPDA